MFSSGCVVSRNRASVIFPVCHCFFYISRASCVSRSSFLNLAVFLALSLSKLPFPLVGTLLALSSYILPYVERGLLRIHRFFGYFPIPSSCVLPIFYCAFLKLLCVLCSHVPFPHLFMVVSSFTTFFIV